MLSHRTPGFIGDRLREARLARGISGVGLSEMLGVSRAAISQYERGETTPRPQLVRAIASRLNVPASYFMRHVERGDDFVFWRSTAATTKSARIRARIRLDWLADLVHHLQETIRFPEVNMPTIELPPSPIEYTQDTIEDAAEATRRYWGLSDGPISNVVWLLENNGIIVSLGEYEEPHLDSFCRYGNTDHFPLMCLNTDKASAVRSRLDAAHELAHLVLHSNIGPEYWSTPARVKQREEQAFNFAGAFLLPRNSFADDVSLPSLDSLLGIKTKWRVSVQAMLMRCITLDLLSEDHKARLWRNLSRRRWRTTEPLDDVVQHEMPRLLTKAIELLADSNPLGPVELVDRLGMSSIDAAQLTMVSKSMFEAPEDSKIIYLYPRDDE